MLMSPVPSRWLNIVAADDDILCADINHEAISNMWCFSPQEDQHETASKAARPFTLTVFVTPLVTAP